MFTWQRVQNAIRRPRPVSATIRPNPQSAMRRMQTRLRRSELEPRGLGKWLQNWHLKLPRGAFCAT
eukprot:2267792-Alexandrium_andersonii.AAC.1